MLFEGATCSVTAAFCVANLHLSIHCPLDVDLRAERVDGCVHLSAGVSF